MKFIVSSSYLLKNLQLIGGVVNTNNTMAILDNFLFRLDHDQLQVSSSDLETTIRANIQVDSDEKGEIAVPAKLLLDILKTFPEQPLTFVKKDNHTFEISSSQGKYALAYTEAEEFPKPLEIENASSLHLPGDVLSTAISKTLFATGNDDMRPTMTGVFFQFTPEALTFVATDAHKLVKYVRTDLKAENLAEFIMPKKPLNLLKNMLDGSESEVEVSFNTNNARFTFDNIELTNRLIDGKYPNYEAVIPKENPNTLVVDRNLFLNSVKRVSIFSNKTTHQIRLKMAGASLQISAEDLDYSNKADEQLTCDYRGDDMQIGFNSRFLTEMLANLLSDEIVLEMSLPNRAGILKPMDSLDEGEQITMLVMPVMLSGS